MTRLRSGDSTATNLLGLAQALECLRRPEDALGATYFASSKDSSGWTDLLIYRAYLFRTLGMEDQAKAVEAQMGGASASESARWFFEPRPQVGGSLGWVHQTENPIQGSLASQYRLWNAQDGSWVGALATQEVGQLDSVFLEGVQVPVSAYLSWGAYSEAATLMGYLSGDAALSETLDQWRSAGFSAFLQWDRSLGKWFSASLSGSATRTIYPALGGAYITDDDLSLGQSLSLKVSMGVFTQGNSLRAVHQETGWTRSGTHALSWSREFLGMLTPSVIGSFAWSKDPMRSSSAMMPALILQAERIVPGISVSSVTLLDTLGRPVGELKQSKLQKDPQPVVARETEIEYPIYASQDLVQAGASFGFGIGRWKGLSGRLGVGWARTFFLERQGGVNLGVDGIYTDSTGHWVIYQDPSSQELYSTSGYTLSGLIPVTWARKRRDDTWSFSAALTWRALKWLSFQGTWTRSQTESNIEDWVDGATNDRETISLGSSVSW